LSTELTKLHCL